MPSKKQVNTKSKVSNRLIGWLKRHKLDVAVITVVLAVCATVSAVNMTGSPMRFEDEGTYISQAWALKETGALTHYTYWYDHPPAGWIQMAGHLVATDALDRYDSAIAAGREFMLVLHLVTVLLVFALARRIGIGTLAAAIGTLAYGLSPLTVEFSRYILLDNVALPWLLGAFFLALNPRRHIFNAVASAACMAVAILSKETFVVMLPILIYALWSNGDKRNRRFTLTAFMVTLFMISSLYALYAVLKNELIPGQGHVSLLGTLSWQVFGREGSGSILNASSGSRGLIGYWLSIDFWLMAAGVIALPFAFFYRQLRVIAFTLLLGLLLLLRTGYLPYPYIITLLPFAALVFAGVLHYSLIAPLQIKHTSFLHLVWDCIVRIALVLLLFGATIFIVPSWSAKLSTLTYVDQDASSRQAVEWVEQKVPKDSRLVVESALWTDLRDKGFKTNPPVWLYKTETDPAVSKEIGGWQGIDYVVLNGPTTGSPKFDESFPTVSEAIKNADLVAEFGTDNQKVLIYEVQHER